ncbi:hypothetical protein JCM10207_006206, partial [Rhodosporidiobolus poonsookiae]
AYGIDDFASLDNLSDADQPPLNKPSSPFFRDYEHYDEERNPLEDDPDFQEMQQIRQRHRHHHP